MYSEMHSLIISPFRFIRHVCFPGIRFYGPIRFLTLPPPCIRPGCNTKTTNSEEKGNKLLFLSEPTVRKHKERKKTKSPQKSELNHHGVFENKTNQLRLKELLHTSHTCDVSEETKTTQTHTQPKMSLRLA